MILNVNSIDLFYEKTGQGQPILLLHGLGEDHTIFDKLIPKLSEDHEVYAIDSRGHGQSGGTGALSYDDMTLDIAAFIQELHLEDPALYGFSDGGIIGLQLASRYPQILSKLIVSGANTNPDGMKKYILTLLRIAYFFSRSAKFKMALTEPDITDDELSRIRIPVLVLAGSKDVIRIDHTEAIAAAISNSTLKIIGGENHSSYIVHSEKLYPIIKPFIN
jgi:pimeloyl-ACP methyl ester carboxylesterase